MPPAFLWPLLVPYAPSVLRRRLPWALAAMTTSESLKAFTERFILATARERFLHEAKKKPQRLLERICHNAQELFDTSLTGNRFKPIETNEYLIPSGKKGFILITGHDALK